MHDALLNSFNSFLIVSTVINWFMFSIWKSKGNINLVVKLTYLILALWSTYLWVNNVAK
mgnify:CR=1 FL=1